MRSQQYTCIMMVQLDNHAACRRHVHSGISYVDYTRRPVICCAKVNQPRGALIQNCWGKVAYPVFSLLHKSVRSTASIFASFRLFALASEVLASRVIRTMQPGFPSAAAMLGMQIICVQLFTQNNHNTNSSNFLCRYR